MDAQHLFTELAEAVADGREPDWGSADLSGLDDTHRALIAQLRAVSEISRCLASATVSTSLSSIGALESQPPADGAVIGRDIPAVWGSLKIRERVGRGRFGDVYRAWDPAIHRDVALKLLRRQHAHDDPSDSVVVQEGRFMARVRHPNVATIYGAAHVDGRTGLWMEFIEGRTLEAELRDRGPFDPAEVAAIGIELCRALGAVHDAGVVHRDVKAQNIMREVTGRVVLGDFGTGLEGQEAEGAATLAGTPLYLAPEIFNLAPATPQSDLYSLGVVLFHLATGSYPVKARTILDVKHAHANGARRRLREVRANVPALFADVVERAVDPDPSRRFQSARDLEQALAATIAPALGTGGGDVAGAATSTTTAWSFVRSQPLLAAAALEQAMLARPALTRETGRRKWVTPTARVAMALVAAVAMAATVAWQMQREPSARGITFQPRDWVLISNFDNATGEQELRDVVTYALERELANSIHVSIVPRARVDDALALMRKPVDSVLNEALAREVAMRDGGIRVLIAGRLEKVGSRYAITSRVIEPSQGVVVAVASEYAERADALSFAIRRLADRIREAVGEQRSTIAQSSVPLEHVTTPSLRALRLYSESFYLGHRARWSGALELARQAVAEDPEFAAARIWLAWSLRNNGHPQQVYVPVAERAMGLSANTTDWERFWILGSYYFLIGDDRRAEGAYLALLQLRPDDYWGVNNLSNIYFRQNRQSEALSYVVKAADLRPNDSRANYNAAYQLSYASRDSARARPYVARVAATGGPERPFELAWARYFEAAVRLQQRDVAGAAKEVTDILRGLPSEPAWAHDALVIKAIRYYLAMGQGNHAQTAAEQLQDRDFHYPFYRAIVAFALDDIDAVRRYVAGVPLNSYVTVTTSLMTRVGLIAPAEALASEVLASDAWSQQRSAGLESMLRGEIAVAKGDLTGSIPFLQSAVARRIAGNHARTSWLLAQVWLRRGDKLKAIDALRASWAHDPRVDIEVDGPYGHDWMPNALLLVDLYRQNGQMKDAEPIEADLAKLLSVADEDFPLLLRLRGLQSGSK